MRIELWTESLVFTCEIDFASQSVFGHHEPRLSRDCFESEACYAIVYQRRCRSVWIIFFGVVKWFWYKVLTLGMTVIESVCLFGLYRVFCGYITYLERTRANLSTNNQDRNVLIWETDSSASNASQWSQKILWPKSSRYSYASFFQNFSLRVKRSDKLWNGNSRPLKWEPWKFVFIF